MEISSGRVKEILIALIVITIVSLIFAFTMNAKNHNELSKRKDMHAKIDRLNVELQKVEQVKAALEENLKEKVSELEDQKRLAASLRSALAQEQLISQSLRTELENANKSKALMEQQLDAKTKARK